MNRENADCPDGSWVKELELEIKEECERQYGTVLHISVDPTTDGDVYIRFDRVESGEKALMGLNGRFFGGQVLQAAPVNDGLYSTLFGRPKALA
jgi:RNA-binding protein 23/39